MNTTIKGSSSRYDPDHIRAMPDRTVPAGAGIWAPVILIMLLISFTGLTDQVGKSIYDLFSEIRLRIGMEVKPPDPVIVGIDESSLREHGSWPWSRRQLARLIKEVAAGRPKVVGIDLLFAEERPEEDEELAEALAILGKSVLIERLDLRVHYGLFQRRLSSGTPEMTIPALRENLSATGFADILPDPDGVVREVPLSVTLDGNWRPAFVSAILSIITASAPNPEGMGRREKSRPGISFAGDTARESLPLTIGREPQAFTFVSAGDLLARRLPPAILKDRIVLIGVTAEGLPTDRFRVAVKKIGDLPGVYLHAYTLATLLVWGETRKVPNICLIILAILAGLVGGRIKSRESSISRAGVASFGGTSFLLLFPAGFFLLSLLLFLGGFWLNPVLPVLTGTLARSILFIKETYRVRAEERRVREIFAKYLSPGVLEEVLRGPRPELAGRRRIITVLIADLRGFTRFSEGNEPEEVVRTLNRHLSIMTDVIFAYGGTLDKYLGDSVMAFFGAPLDQEDHRQRALQAALEMIEALSIDDRNLPVGIGIATGEVMVGNIGSGRRMDYTAIGDPVNVAARLQSLAGPGEILATEETFLRDEGVGLVNQWRVLTLRGRETPVRVGLIKAPGLNLKEAEKGKETGKGNGRN